MPRVRARSWWGPGIEPPNNALKQTSAHIRARDGCNDDSEKVCWSTQPRGPAPIVHRQVRAARPEVDPRRQKRGAQAVPNGQRAGMGQLQLLRYRLLTDRAAGRLYQGGDITCAIRSSDKRKASGSASLATAIVFWSSWRECGLPRWNLAQTSRCRVLRSWRSRGQKPWNG